jgi:phage shock protein A
MFNKLKEAIESALGALEGKAGESPRADIERLLEGMRQELIETRARIPLLEEQVRKLRSSHELESRKADECHRRAVQAQSIGDDETVEVALRFEAKHRVALDVWVQKIEAAEAELAMQKQNVDEMTEQLKTARSRRDAIEIQARRAGATGRMRGGGHSAVDEFDRLADEIGREDDLGAAERTVERDLRGAGDPTTGPDSDDFDDVGSRGTLSREELAALQLEELKRRMKDEGGKG